MRGGGGVNKGVPDIPLEGVFCAKTHHSSLSYTMENVLHMPCAQATLGKSRKRIHVLHLF